MRRQPFKKGYVGNWSDEIFEIDARLPTVPVTYRLKDLSGDTIKGKFYEPEIQKVFKSEEDYFDEEKILKTRRRGGRIEYVVKWLGYPSKFNSWTNTLSRFHLTLPSNSSMDYYPENTVARFTTKLPNNIDLDGEWEVGQTNARVVCRVTSRAARTDSATESRAASRRIFL